MKIVVDKKRTGRRAALTAAAAVIVLAAAPLPQAHAGIWSSLKDIYDTPAKVEELQRQYTESVARLEEQQRKLREDYSQKQAELEQRQQELMEQNEAYQEQNGRLQQQNDALEAKLRQAEERSAAVKRGIAWSVLALSSAFLGYIAAIRIWRYRAYRAQSRSGGGTAS
ncbi:hypothetical protein HGI30_05100 [Paenibacillus albicereus]|uniref:DUF3450 domain-containing protein n=1 Tax=Paenibacillus albicereus TaxID=2726185 RepID=A0A6H2GV20_9BACL|nr:hypothetical protein [Paenibacillus albicereus]QJC50998.1 hypothetical protein HGI30_05100 [Paenibacillus albicereus]